MTFRSAFAVLAIFSCAVAAAMAQTRTVSETVRGSIFRYATYVSVDQYMLDISTNSAMVEFDILSMETADNVTFRDVNNDCDSAFIDSKIYLYQRRPADGALVLVALNDDEGDDDTAYFGKGRRDGSLNTQDSYMVRQLTRGTYMLAVGRYPLSSASARTGKSPESVTSFSPYSCQMRRASYGNYQLTIRVQSTASTGIIKSYANSYVGNSCSTAGKIGQCVYTLPGNFRQAILSRCAYDRTVL